MPPKKGITGWREPGRNPGASARRSKAEMSRRWGSPASSLQLLKGRAQGGPGSRITAGEEWMNGQANMKRPSHKNMRWGLNRLTGTPWGELLVVPEENDVLDAGG